jgi:proton glutamate symport protein
MLQDVSSRQAMQRPRYRPSLTMQIMIGLVIGIVIGWLRPDWGNAVYFLRDIFLNLIKSIIGPLVFSTLVVGIAGGGNLRKVGRIGVKALVYFEIITTAALFIGLAVVNIAKPGIGVPLIGNQSEVVQKIGETHPSTLIETLVHVFPSSVIDSLVRGDILQIVAFAVLFAGGVGRGQKGKAGPSRDGESVAGDVQIHELRHAVRAVRCRRGDGPHDRFTRSGRAR